MQLHTLGEIGRINGLRLKAEKEQGGDIPGMGNISKLSMSEIMRLTRDLGLRIVGPAGMLHAYNGEGRKALDEATGNPFLGMVTEMALVRAGAADLRRHRPGAAQHHRRARPRSPQGAERRSHAPVLGASEERVRGCWRCSTTAVDSSWPICPSRRFYQEADGLVGTEARPGTPQTQPRRGRDESETDDIDHAHAIDAGWPRRPVVDHPHTRPEEEHERDRHCHGRDDDLVAQYAR